MNFSTRLDSALTSDGTASAVTEAARTWRRDGMTTILLTHFLTGAHPAFYVRLAMPGCL